MELGPGGCRSRRGGLFGPAPSGPFSRAGGLGRQWCVPYGWPGLFRNLGAQRPGGPPARRGPHFSREMGRKRAGGKPPGPPVLWPARCHSLVWGLWRMVPAVELLRGPGACPDWGAFFRGIFWGHMEGHVEQNSVCRDTNAVDERNQPHLVFWLYFITFLQYFPLFFRISLPSRGAPARWGTAYPSGGRGFSGASGRSAPGARLPGGGPHFSREMGRKRAGAPPLDPGFHSRSFPLAGFWDGCP